MSTTEIEYSQMLILNKNKNRINHFVYIIPKTELTKPTKRPVFLESVTQNCMFDFFTRVPSPKFQSHLRSIRAISTFKSMGVGAYHFHTCPKYDMDARPCMCMLATSNFQQKSHKHLIA